MPEAVISTDPKPRDWSASAGLLLRRIIAAAIVIAALIVAFAAAGVIALAALLIAVSVAVGLGLMWLWARITGRSAPARFTVWRVRTVQRDEYEAARKLDSAETLDAQKGPQGWTVETDERKP
ncbi:MAG: hypothetical protein PVI23_02205 [Maricaulaceae bacterium]|jgi:hypothetical protein